MAAPPTPWHPIVDALEVRVGVWDLVNTFGKRYGLVTLVRRGPEVGYRATSTVDAVPVILSYHRTLRGACESAYRAYLASIGPRGGPVAAWGGARRR